MLCEQFWGGARSDGQEAPLLALLVGCRERYPADAAPLLRALAALSEVGAVQLLEYSLSIALERATGLVTQPLKP
jgi:hypothetical protein